MGKLSRQKGKRGEREVVLRAKAFGLDALRTWETAQHIGCPESRACDVRIEGQPYQVKLYKSMKTIYSWLEHVEGAFVRQNGGIWLAVVPAEDYLKLLADSKHPA